MNFTMAAEFPLMCLFLQSQMNDQRDAGTPWWWNSLRIIHAVHKKKRSEAWFYLVKLFLPQLIRQHQGNNAVACIWYYCAFIPLNANKSFPESFISLTLAFGWNAVVLFYFPLHICLCSPGWTIRGRVQIKKCVFQCDTGALWYYTVTQQPTVALYVWSQLTPSHCLADIHPTRSSASAPIGRAGRDGRDATWVKTTPPATVRAGSNINGN